MVFSQKLITRYSELKKEVPDCVLLMQVGAFMQVMSEDAEVLSKLTGLKLHKGGDVEAPVKLGGFPKSGLDKYIGKLVRAGYSVAVALQDDTKERHIKEIVRIVVQRINEINEFKTIQRIEDNGLENKRIQDSTTN
jgi:DNA mismatch repair ATPase MutS